MPVNSRARPRDVTTLPHPASDLPKYIGPSRSLRDLQGTPLRSLPSRLVGGRSTGHRDLRRRHFSIQWCSLDPDGAKNLGVVPDCLENRAVQIRLEVDFPFRAIAEGDKHPKFFQGLHVADANKWSQSFHDHSLVQSSGSTGCKGSPCWAFTQFARSSGRCANAHSTTIACARHAGISVGICCAL